MIIEKNKVLNTVGKKAIVYDVYYSLSTKPKPVVIFCHGYKGFKDWGAWHLVAEEFVKAGFFFLKFNFSHNGGTVGQPIDFPDLEAFANNNFSTELDDLDRVLDFVVEENSFYDKINFEKINLIGHSRGGGIVLIKTEEDERIKKVVTWAGLSDFKARFQEETEAFRKWQSTGITYVENGRTKQQMPHYIQFYDDFKLNEEKLTIKRAVQNLKKPQLIVHGGLDSTVSVHEAQTLHMWNQNSQLEIVEQADHVFGVKHPWEKEELSADLKQAVATSINFLR